MPPKWIQQPHDTEAVVGQDLLLHCQASGYPAVRTWWEFQSASASQQLAKSSSNALSASANGKNQSPALSSKATYQNVISNSHIHTLENGTLIIREVTKADEGQWSLLVYSTLVGYSWQIFGQFLFNFGQVCKQICGQFCLLPSLCFVLSHCFLSKGNCMLFLPFCPRPFPSPHS